VQAGWRLLEVPLNSPDPLRSIERLARRFPDALVGAGTVRTAEEVKQVQDAGGQLVVSPHFDEDVVDASVRLGMVSLPGVMTPSEAFAAIACGATALKLFPAEMIGPAAVKALRAVLPPDVLLLPVGGIAPANIAAYRAAGASGFGIGSALYKPGMDAQAVAASARAFADAWAGTMRA
jgi:2-dehydro-3-deoxyphosphogalactonate aldolase